MSYLHLSTIKTHKRAEASCFEHLSRPRQGAVETLKILCVGEASATEEHLKFQLR